MTIYTPPVSSYQPTSELVSGMAAATLDDLATCISGQSLNTGQTLAVLARVNPGKAGQAVSNLYYSCSTAEVGGTAGQNLIGAYTPDGQTQLGVTGDLSNAGTTGNWTTTGANKVTPISFVIPATAQYIWLVVLAVFATTAPGLRSTGASVGAGAIAAGVQPIRAGQIAAAQTALPATFNPAAITVGPALLPGLAVA